jgi:parallel beta-helix repeat protein
LHTVNLQIATKNKKTFHALLRVVILITLVSAFFTPNVAVQAAGTTYYVSPSGNDSSSGSINSPWKTIRKASLSVVAGDTVYIRGGIFYESVELSRSGTSISPISFLAYPGETPVLDGNNYTIPSTLYGPLLKINGNYIKVSGLEVRYSRGMGVALNGVNVTVSNINSHHNKENGILITGDNGKVTNSRVWSNCMQNVNGSSGSGWSSGLSAARRPNNAKISDNVVFGNWGEGVSTYQASGTIIEDNTIYDNWSANIYVSDAANVLVQRNFVYATGATSGGSQVGIMMGDEKYDPPSSNIKIINNIVYSTRRNLYWWQGSNGGGMVGVSISHNTFVNSTSSFDVQLAAGSHSNSTVTNNIFVQEGSLPVIYSPSNPGLVIRNNLWSKTPPSSASGSGDIVADPKFQKTGSPTTPEWYELSDDSPAIDKAQSSDLVYDDFFGVDRGITRDIGAIEAEDVASNPLPIINYIYPKQKLVGKSGFTLTVYGKQFTADSLVRYNGNDRATTYIDSKTLSIGVTTQDLATAGVAKITVFTPSPGGGTSNSKDFTINNDIPVINSVMPSSRTAGGPSFTLTVIGKKFVNGSVVRWNGNDRPTTFVNAYKLTAVITAQDIVSIGTAAITVFNPVPGGGISNSMTFTIK